jgi:hypothetical protein
MTEREAAEDRHPVRTEMLSLVGGVNLVVLVLAIAAGVWGTFETMADAAGEGAGGIVAIAAPGVYAGWCMLEMAWKRLAGIGMVMLRLLTACFVAPLFAAIPIGVIQAVAVAFPGARRTIDDARVHNDGFHYWWSEGIGAQLALVPGAGYVIGMCVPLAVLLIVVMPVVAIRAPRVAAEGSHLEQVAASRRRTTTALVYVGLGATTLGIGLWEFGKGGSVMEFPRDLGRFLEDLSRGYPQWADAVWLVGAVVVALGVLAMAWACVRVLVARWRSARGDGAETS